MDLNELQKRVYQTAQAKGWHDGRPNGIPYRETRALVVSELSEALEAFREDKMTVEFRYAKCGIDPDCEAEVLEFAGVTHSLYNKYPRRPRTHEDGLVLASRRHKPEGFGIELADTAIRVLHRTGAAKRTWDEYDHRYIANDISRRFPTDVVTVPEQIDWLIETAIKIDIEAIFLARLNAVACANNVDLWAAVELKAKYNETRPYKHGNKRA